MNTRTATTDATRDRTVGDEIDTRIKNDAGQDDQTQETGGTGDRDDDVAEVEGRARRLGWTPQDQFRGPKANWLPADQFVDKVEGEVPVMRERLRFQDDEIKKRDRQITELNGLFEEQSTLLRELVKKTRTGEQRDYESQRRAIKNRISEAAKSADLAAHAAAMEELEELEKNRPTVEPERQPASKPNGDDTDEQPPPRRRDDRRPDGQRQQQHPQVSQDVEQWVGENPWFNTDRVANSAAVTLHGQNIANGMSEADSLVDVRAEIERRFPEHFENGLRKAPAAVRTPSPPPRRQRTGKTYDDLPADAKAQCDQYCRTIKGYTREEYVKDYQWEK